VVGRTDRFSLSTSFLALSLALLISACAATRPPPPPVAAPADLPASALQQAAPPPVPSPPGEVCEARVGPDRLRRDAMTRTVDAGLGNWLQGISVDPLLERGRFRGWIVRSLPSGQACYAGIDLQAGDVVTRVNGHSIERPEQAHEVWVGLRTSPALVVDFLRDGQAHTLRFAIVDP
jgi:type II secretory pathway component PulC